MKLWLRKLMVAIVAVITLGFYIPQFEVTTDADDRKDSFSEKSTISNEQAVVIVDKSEFEKAPKKLEHVSFSKEMYIQQLTDQAKEQVFLKFGSRMIDRVEEDFTMDILPVLEETITSLLEDVEDDDMTYFTITEKPASGLGERIFHVYDVRNDTDIALFHVRRENRPLEGYWFNFHYHLQEDNFEAHHHIGDIYWDKNIPPRWMS